MDSEELVFNKLKRAYKTVDEVTKHYRGSDTSIRSKEFQLYVLAIGWTLDEFYEGWDEMLIRMGHPIGIHKPVINLTKD